MKTEKAIVIDKPPYPRIGEIYRTFSLAVDTKTSNRDVDRLAREGEFDWFLLSKLSEELILTPLRNHIDSEFSKLISKHLQNLHNNYEGLVLSVCVDGLTRDEALPLLIENYFTSFGTSLILDIKDKFGGPELMELLDPERHPISVVLDWFDEGGISQLAKVAYPATTDTDKISRDRLIRWAKGIQLPDISSIKLFVDALTTHGSEINKQNASNLRRWLLVARALKFMEQKAVSVPIRAVMRKHLLTGLPNIDIGYVLSIAVLQTSERLFPLKDPALSLYEQLKRKTQKSSGDQTKTRKELDALEQLTTQYDPEGRTIFHIEWLKGRWQILSGNYQAALAHYRKATDLANYRAGGNQIQLVEEAYVLAGNLGEKVYLKQLKHWAVAFKIFQAPIEGPMIENWEFEYLQQQFHRIFPAQGHFKESLLTEPR